MPAPGAVGPRGAGAVPPAAATSPSGAGTVPPALVRMPPAGAARVPIGRRPSASPGPGGRGRRAPAALVALALAALVLGGCGGRTSDRPAGPGALPPAPGPASDLEGAGPAAGSTGPGPASGPIDSRPAAPGPIPTRDPRAAAGSFDAPGLPPRAPGFEVGGLPRQLAAPGRAAAPVRLAIPAIGVATRLVRLGLDADGGMQVPEDFDRAGWFAEGPVPGQVGPAVIAGHVDSRSGPAVFHRLRDLRPGDAVLVERADGARLRFLVEQARSFPKAGFPTAAVFGPVPSAALRLVTCAGDFDRARDSYRDNLVVFARLAAVGR